jgi:hypothetical protein
MFPEILPDSEEEEEEEEEGRWVATAGPTTDAGGMELPLLPPPPPLDPDAAPAEDRLPERMEAERSLVTLATLPASSPPEW